MFMLNIEGGENFGMPDVCKTPMGPAIVPIPYPNISTNLLADPATTGTTVLADFMPSVNQMTEVMLSQGDDAGLLLGLISEMVMGPTEYLVGCDTVLIEGMPAQRLTSMTQHNGVAANCVGACIAPSQVTILTL